MVAKRHALRVLPRLLRAHRLAHRMRPASDHQADHQSGHLVAEHGGKPRGQRIEGMSPTARSSARSQTAAQDVAGKPLYPRCAFVGSGQ